MWILLVAFIIVVGAAYWKYLSWRQKNQSPAPGKARAVNMQLNQQKRVADESLEIVYKTKDLDIFLSRFRDAINNCRLIDIRCNTNNVDGLMEKFPEFLSECVSKVIDDICLLKTDSGQMNRAKKCVDQLNKAWMYIPEINEIQFALDKEKLRLNNFFHLNENSASPNSDSVSSFMTEYGIKISISSYTKDPEESEFGKALRRHFSAIEELKTHTFDKKIISDEIVYMSAQEMRFLFYLDGKNKTGNIAEKWTTHEGIDIIPAIQKFYSYGYLCDGNKAKGLVQLKVEQLKDILKSRGQKVTGKKDELIERIKSCCGESDLCTFDVPDVFSLTAKAKEVLKINDITDVVHYNNFTVPQNAILDRYSQLIMQNENFSMRDALWSLLEDHCTIAMMVGHWNDVSSIDIERTKFSLEEKQYEKAFQYVSRAFYVQVSGMQNNSEVCSFDEIIIRNDLRKMFEDCCTGMGIEALNENNSPNSEFDSRYLKSIAGVFQLPFSYFLPEDSLEVLHNHLVSEEYDLQEDYFLAQKPSSESEDYYYIDDV